VATYDDDLRLAHVLADAVERITMSRFRAEDLVVESKPDLTLVSDADKSAEDVAKFGADSDMGRPAQPEEISPAYVFLASPVTASYVNGVVLPVMGGPRG
jgi:NAD(P)-dependent dehydrogenase (short-subunit alcohol dehydrogenase family)